MCGLNVIYRNDNRAPTMGCMKRMNYALSHRGPDGDGIYIRPGIALGHTRLSVIDVDNGQQPMSSDDEQFTIVYNGELYNYRTLRKDLLSRGVIFKTRSDTEVVLMLYRLYGADCVNKMRGMFSFVVYEKNSGKLFLARDRLGIKPLFYHWTGSTLIAASEIKAIFASGYVEAKLNKASIINYFTYQFSITPNTPYESIFELSPGYCMTISHRGDPVLFQYWDVEFPKHGDYETDREDYWLDAFESALDDSVKSHAVSDVEIGSYLSGGIDSCTITELLSKNTSTRMKTFSIGFDSDEHDESDAYRRVAEYLGVENNEIKFSMDGDYLNKLKESLYHLEQPQRMSVDVPHFELSKLVSDNNCKVVCTGDGADEILAGYDCYRQDAMRTNSNGLFNQLWRRKKYPKEYTEYFASDHMELLLSLHKRRKQYKTIENYGFYPVWFDFWQITGTSLSDLFLPEVVSGSNNQKQMDELVSTVKPNIKNLHPLNQSLYLETKTRLPGWILWKCDRLSMAHGVEARVPFLDHKLVELTAKMPPNYKLMGMNEKYILKRMMKNRLPNVSHHYKKRGFYTPIRQWFFTARQKPYIDKYISTEALNRSEIFNPVTVRDIYNKLLDMSKPGDMNSYYRCMRMEWVLLTVLSVQILYNLFVQEQGIILNQASRFEEIKHASL